MLDTIYDAEYERTQLQTMSVYLVHLLFVVSARQSLSWLFYFTNLLFKTFLCTVLSAHEGLSMVLIGLFLSLLLYQWFVTFSALFPFTISRLRFTLSFEIDPKNGHKNRFSPSKSV